MAWACNFMCSRGEGSTFSRVSVGEGTSTSAWSIMVGLWRPDANCQSHVDRMHQSRLLTSRS